MMFTARSTRRAAVAAALALTVAGLPQISWAAPAATGVVLDQGGDHVTLENGYTHLTFDLAHPQIDDVRADFTGNGDYGPSLTAAGNGIVLERHDLAPANVVNEIGVTDDAHRVNGQITPQFSYAAELLPAANSVVTPPDDTIDDVPVRMPDSSGSGPNIAVAKGQTFTLDSAEPISTLDVFGASSDGTGTGALTGSYPVTDTWDGSGWGRASEPR